MKNKKQKEYIFDLLHNMYREGLLSKDENHVFESIIDGASDDTLPLIESEIYDRAQSTTNIVKDVKLVCKIIAEVFKYDPGEMPKPKFNEFQYDGYELYKIFSRKMSSKKARTTKAIRNNTVYHIVLKVLFNENTYSFGYNKAQGTLSFSVNNGRIKYSKISATSKKDINLELNDAIKYIMNVDRLHK
jgi:hypothetical protein